MFPILIDYAIRSTLLLALTAAAVLLLRRRSSAWRHLIWLAGLLSLLALPAAKLVAPQWNAPVMTQTLLTAPARTVINVTSGPANQKRSVDWLFAAWLCGAAVFLIRMGRAQVKAHRLVKRARPGSNGAFISDETDVPIVCGLIDPVVVLPAESASWPLERLESVLRHERMHIARRDTLSQAMAQLACAVYWPQPLVWLAASAMRSACEQACDDGVLSQGTRPSIYAEHLMDIARALNPRASAAFEGGIAMTRTNQLEERISALLNSKHDRRAAGATFVATVTALAVTAVIALAALRTPLLAQSGKLAGVVRDASGAMIPRARVDIRTSAGTAKSDTPPIHEIVYSNEAGEFSLDNIPDGVYDIAILSPGFAKQEHQGVLFESAKAKRMDMTLEIGRIQERITVQAERIGAPAIQQAGPPRQIRVGGNVQAANLIKKVTPLYPSGAKYDRVEGTVIMKAVISKDGSILSLEQVNKQIDPRLAESAMEAVKQWMYKPTLLNGEPIEVITEIEVNFTLTR